MPTAKELGRPIELLLVEDSPSDVGLIKAALQNIKTPLNLRHVENGEEALAYLRNEGKHGDAQRPDVILLDLKMPRMGGIEFLDELGSDDRMKRIPVIVLTTSDHEQDIVAAYDLNAKAYLRKPIEFAGLIAMMKAFDAFWLSNVTLPPQQS